ncbi:hypothetical protein [Photorhabdus heterorhabditis]|uniref:hypothetical protein n=1 Tax=Photorhabdus heterorhabditis TaxID=880156 RepID=UPI000A5F5695|nr:hypothetical protein [Photorhabdus heterorhabditis]
MFSIYKIISWRIMYYINNTFNLLKKRVLFFLLILLMISPMAVPFISQMRLLSIPIMSFLSMRELYNSLIYWSLIVGIFVFWIGAQKKSIMSNDSDLFLKTLPLKRNARRLVDYITYLIIDIPLLLPFLSSLFFRDYTNESLSSSIETNVLIIAILLLLVSLQILFLKSILMGFILFIISLSIPLLLYNYYPLLFLCLFLIFSSLYLSDNFRINFSILKKDKKTHSIKNSSFFKNITFILLKFIFSPDYSFRLIAKLLISFFSIIIVLFFNEKYISFNEFTYLIVLSYLMLSLNIISSASYFDVIMKDFFLYLTSIGITNQYLYLTRIFWLTILMFVFFVPVSIFLSLINIHHSLCLFLLSLFFVFIIDRINSVKKYLVITNVFSWSLYVFLIHQVLVN